MSTCFKPGFDYCMVKVNSSRQGGGGVNTRLRTQNHHQDKHREYKSLSDSLRANLSPHNADTANCVHGKQNTLAREVNIVFLSCVVGQPFTWHCLRSSTVTASKSHTQWCCPRPCYNEHSLVNNATLRGDHTLRPGIADGVTKKWRRV